jgi:hypothetical protein
MSFRNIIGATALTHVQSFLQKFSPDKIEKYVQDSFNYHGEIPFLYRVFDRTEVTSDVEEHKYKVVSVLRPLA